MMRALFLELASLSFVFQHLALASNHIPFNPNSYPKHIATCKAINRAKNHTTPVDIKLRMSDLHLAGLLSHL
jgi:hypothetical protein